MELVRSYRDLIVWQKSMDLVTVVYRLSKQFPSCEQFGLTSQMRRCAVSIPSNIAEGKYRGTRKDFRQFLVIAYASGAELETQIEIANRLSYATEEASIAASNLLQEIMKMLNKMIASLKD